MKKLKFKEIEYEPVEYEDLRPKVKYKEILKAEDDWLDEKYSPPKINGVLSDEHRNHG